ncbi:hypothetical protein [Gayadomonas joobiniege]|uniref:hypothetical protein n=1 Tax=Gayadomonas joobiniege TaxID=1234606 RepID=UPI00036456F2|nr:hypothetical protein [Gayadomonas joobiniege]
MLINPEQIGQTSVNFLRQQRAYTNEYSAHVFTFIADECAFNSDSAEEIIAKVSVQFALLTGISEQQWQRLLQQIEISDNLDLDDPGVFFNC